MVDTLEHEFLRLGDDSMLMLLRLAQFITCGLILATNIPMIMFIMKQGSKTFLDWLIVIDCLLCLSNLHVIALGPKNNKINEWNGTMEHSTDHFDLVQSHLEIRTQSSYTNHAKIPCQQDGADA